jgi:outer membrane protein OmpA-like peptidoglycan-associated protein
VEVAPIPATPIATVVRPAELSAAVAARRDSLIKLGQGLNADEVGYYLDVQEARFRQIASTWLLVSRREERVVLSIPGTLSFDVGSTTLSPRAVEALGSIARVLVEYRSTVVALQGHTDSLGDATINQRLSEQRALVVARVLIAGGVAAERLVVTGYGATNPAASNATEEGRDANRRVEIEVSPLYSGPSRNQEP